MSQVFENNITGPLQSVCTECTVQN